jgi:hypothetical protein
MSELLRLALNAHGCIDRWRRVETVALELSIGGALWDLKGQTGLFAKATYEADVRIQRAKLGHFGPSSGQVLFTPERVVLEDRAGRVIDSRDNPRAAFAGHRNETPWDLLHAAYFQGYAVWTYLTQPFLYSYAGFDVEEIEPWQEDGQTWRRLQVTFPEYIATHGRQQISYFGSDGLLRRHDYAVDVLGGATGAHYVDGYQDHNGIMIPHRRRVYPRGADNQKVPAPVLVSIDIGEVEFKPALPSGENDH